MELGQRAALGIEIIRHLEPYYPPSVRSRLVSRLQTLDEDETHGKSLGYMR